MISSDWQSQIFENKKKKNGGPNLGQMGHFLRFGSLVFLKFRYNDSLQRCLISSIKIHEKHFWAKGAKIGPETWLFAIL